MNNYGKSSVFYFYFLFFCLQCESKWFSSSCRIIWELCFPFWSHLISFFLRDSLLETESPNADGINVIEHRKHLPHSVVKINLTSRRKFFKNPRTRSIESAALLGAHLAAGGQSFWAGSSSLGPAASTLKPRELKLVNALRACTNGSILIICFMT